MTGGELRDLRKVRELTLDGLATLLGVTRQAVFQLEQREQLSPATEASVRVALAGFDGSPLPACRPAPLACPICGQACDSGPASPAYVLSEHLRSRHGDRAGMLISPGASIVDSPVRAFRIHDGDAGWAESTGDLTIAVIFGDHPVAILPLPLSGRWAYQWIPAAVPEEGRLS